MTRDEEQPFITAHYLFTEDIWGKHDTIVYLLARCTYNYTGCAAAAPPASELDLSLVASDSLGI